jgi:small redox-active disulfide protein 2
MIIKILGSGCKRCVTLEQTVKSIVKENQIDAVIEKVTDIQEIINYGVLATPAIVINEKVVSYGTIPPNDKILELLKKGV